MVDPRNFFFFIFSPFSPGGPGAPPVTTMSSAAASGDAKRSRVEADSADAEAASARAAAEHDIDGFIAPLLSRLTAENKALLAARVPWAPLSSPERERLCAHPFFLSAEETLQFLKRVREYEVAEAAFDHKKRQCRVFCFALVFDASKEGTARLTWTAPYDLPTAFGETVLPVLPPHTLVAREIVQL